VLPGVVGLPDPRLGDVTKTTIPGVENPWIPMPDPQRKLNIGDNAIYSFPDGDYLCRVVLREPDGRMVQVRRLRRWADEELGEADD
jgi:hypothetical protein